MLALTLLALSASAAPFELKDGDRVVWIGGTIAEREQKYGHWETALLMKFPDSNITFRNLGWSGDTVKGEARAAFDPPAKGYERLLQSVKNAKPTVIFVSYGSVEALGDWNHLQFKDGYLNLLNDLAATKARLVLMTPTPLEEKNKGHELRDLRDVRIMDFAQLIRHQREQGHRVADLFTIIGNHYENNKSLTLTDNGLHFNEAGYETTIPDFLTSLGLSWEGVDPKTYEAVRKAVVKKNELVFHQWRPQNETYLFGFRRHEQGQNAKDIPAFDPLIDAAEKEIRKLLK